MKKFELWLDESGDFNNDIQKVNNKANPSLIGGLLVEFNTFPESYINAILPEDTYHSVDENDQLDRFKIIVEKLDISKANRIVVFSNQECIMILDNNLTYLNIITEGILQLIKHLKAQFEDVFLRVVIANRVNTTSGLDPAQSVVPVDEYVKRLKEKLILASLENAISESEWELQTASARKDKRLMLSDIICNTYYTRLRKRKFSDTERNYIESIYRDDQKTMIFTVFESVLEKMFKNNLMENRIGEAVAEICLSKDKNTLDRCFTLLCDNFNERGVHDIVFQYKFIKAYIEYYINVVRDFDLCENLLNNLLLYYIPLLSKYSDKGSNLAEELEVDIRFYLFTVNTHLGDVTKSDEIEEECERHINKLPASLENIDYKIRFENRKITNLINSFDFETALKYANVLVEKCSEIRDLLDLISNDQKNYYDGLAKALGTRLQIQMFMLREKNNYDDCRRDSDNAIEQFINEEDKRRQYLYRVQLETEHNDYDMALNYLKKAVGLVPSATIKELWARIEKNSIFAISAYVRLMAEAEEGGLSDEMHKVLSNSGYLLKVDNQQKLFHPYEIILWKYAYYCSKTGMINSAIKYYEKAIEACFANDDLTLNVIGTGIDFEEYAFLIKENRKEATTHRKQMRKRWDRTRVKDKKGILTKVFGEVDFQNDDMQYYRLLGRRITY